MNYLARGASAEDAEGGGGEWGRRKQGGDSRVAGVVGDIGTGITD